MYLYGWMKVRVSHIDPDDQECLWTDHVSIEAESEGKGRRDGAQASKSERMRPRFCEQEPVGVNLKERINQKSACKLVI